MLRSSLVDQILVDQSSVDQNWGGLELGESIPADHAAAVGGQLRAGRLSVHISQLVAWCMTASLLS